MNWKPSHGKTLVCVYWLDAHSSATRAFTEENVLHKTAPMETYGLLIKDDEAGVSIANETYMDDIENVQTYRGHTFIPRGMVVRVDVLLSPASKRTHGRKRVHRHRSDNGRTEGIQASPVQSDPV